MEAESPNANDLAINALTAARTQPAITGRQDDRRRARALKLLQAGQAAAAADQFRRIIRDSPDSLEDRVLFAQALAESGETLKAERELETGIAQAPHEPDLHACLGQVVARTGRRVAAVRHYERALALAPRHWAAAELTALKAEISAAIHAWHLPMLADMARNDAFQATIEAAVRPDDLVLDIGTGTGLLAMMAARAGARTVVACEALPDMADLARLVVAANGYSDQITVLAKHSTSLAVGADLPRRATLLVAEIFDALLIGEGALDSFAHARSHLLAPGARIIPAAGIVRGQLATMPRLKTMHPLGAVSGFDLSSFARHATEKQFYPMERYGEHWTPMSEPFDVLNIDFHRRNLGRRDWHFPVAVTHTGLVQALVLWLELQLDATTRICAGPCGTLRHWNPVAFLFDNEQSVTAGETLQITARMGGNVLFFAMPGSANTNVKL